MTRGTSNSNARGNTRDREARRAFLFTKYGNGTHCPCYRCATILDASTLTVDRIRPGCQGGRYIRSNIRPACGKCNSETGSQLAVKVHHCIDCKRLPEDQRPPNPRPIPVGQQGPKRCATHARAFKNRGRQRAREKRSEKVYGLAPGVRAQLVALQDGKCPICLRGLDFDAKTGRWRSTHHDHSHELAAQHDHPDDQACEDCLRGLLCGYCNRELLVRVPDLEAALRIVAYYENPPMAQLRAAQLKEAC